MGCAIKSLVAKTSHIFTLILAQISNNTLKKRKSREIERKIGLLRLRRLAKSYI